MSGNDRGDGPGTGRPEAAAGASRRSSWLVATALVASSLLVSFLLAEAILRLHFAWKGAKVLEDLASTEAPAAGSEVRLGDILLPSRHERLVYRLRPNLDVVFGGVALRTNSAGWRDEELEPETDAQSVRILVLGDSVVFGWRVEERERFGDLLERRLAAEYPRLEWRTLSMAAPGYNLPMEVEALRLFGLDFEPHLVIYGFVANDHCLPNFVTPRIEIVSLRSFVRLYVARGGSARRTRIPRSELVVPAEEAEDAPEWGGFCTAERVPEAYRDLVGREAFWSALGELERLTAARGIPTVVLNLARTRRLIEERPLPGDLMYLDVLAARSAWLAEHGGGPYMESALVHGGGDPHPTAEGHRLVADELFDFLVAEGIHRRWIER